MTKTEFVQHLMDEYISVITTCSFAYENYTQTSIPGVNLDLRSRYNKFLKGYEDTYTGCHEWTPSFTKLTDLCTVDFLKQCALVEVHHFIADFEKCIPTFNGMSFDLHAEWTTVLGKNNKQLAPSILELLKNLRIWEEQALQQ